MVLALSLFGAALIGVVLFATAALARGEQRMNREVGR